MPVRRVLSAWVVLAAAVALSPQAAAQDGSRLSGRLLNSLSGAPIAGATVAVEELRREATSSADGTFTFENVPPGTYHLSVRAQGYSSRRTEVSLVPARRPLDVLVDPELHFEEVVSVGAEARSQFESFQPTSVLAGQELSKQLEMSLGATLESQPGVASRSFGPAPARPVIRGLDGDRVLILQDGQRMGDLSSQSGDHGVTINPAAAQRIEVVRGPATLLYGANAIGGLVNVITDEIPTTAEGRQRQLHVRSRYGAERSGGGRRRARRQRHGRPARRRRRPPVGRRGDAGGRPRNSQSRNGFGNVGLAWTGARATSAAATATTTRDTESRWSKTARCS